MKRMNRLASAFALIATAALAGGCRDEANYLDGSIKTSHDLGFDRVTQRFLTDQAVYQLTWFRNIDDENPGATDAGGGGEDLVAKLTFNEPAGGAQKDALIDIKAADAEGRVEGNPQNPFPAELESATVTFTSDVVLDETVTGEMAITFGNGKTLDGAWEQPLIAEQF